MKPTEPRKNYAFAYIRVSKEEQAQEGWSIDAQESEAKRYWEYRLKPKGIEWGSLFADEGVSAFRVDFKERPAGGKLLQAIQKGDHVIFVKLDRGFRNIRDLNNTLPLFNVKGVSLHFMNLNIDTTTAMGQLILQIMAAVAEWESRNISERTKAAFAEKMRQGYAHPGGNKKRGGRRWGKIRWKDKDGNWLEIDNPRERAIMDEIARLKEEEKWSWPKIADHIEQAMCEYEGRPFHKSIFRRTWSAKECINAYEAIKYMRKREAAEAEEILRRQHGSLP